MFLADWVIHLSEVGKDGLYDYAVLTDPQLAELMVLARNVRIFEEQYEVDIISWLLSEGFTTDEKKPQIIYHDSSCHYPAALENNQYPCEQTVMKMYEILINIQDLMPISLDFHS